MRYACFIVLLAAIQFTSGQRLSAETCQAPKPFVEVFPDADVVIGVIIDVHRSGEGVYGCGGTSEVGLIMYEAMRWCTSVLNQETGLINGLSVTDSFIPGVRIGLRVYDSCSHRDLAVHQLVDLFPIIKSGSSSCSFATNSSVLVLGVIDQTEVTNIPRIEESFHHHHLTGIDLRSTFLSPSYLAKVLIGVAEFLHWDKVAILQQNDNYSNAVVDLLSESLCIVSKTLLSEEVTKNYRKNLAYLATILKKNTGIIVIAEGEPLNRLIRAMGESKDAASRLQWLFSWVLPSEPLSALVGISNIYSLAPHPMKSAELESHWKRLSDPAGYTFENDTSWFREYLHQRSRCESCRNMAAHDTQLETLYRTSRMLSAFNAVYTAAHSLRSVWRDKCEGLRGLCDAIHQMSRQEFLESYLHSDGFLHTAVDRSPSGLFGYRNPLDFLGKAEGGKVTIGAYHIENDVPMYSPVALYEEGIITSVDTDFHPLPSLCPKVRCSDCIRNRQGRMGDLPNVRKDGITVLGSPDDVFLVVLLPLHHAGTNPLECGSKLRMEAVEDLEAVIWTTDLINANQSYLPGMKLGIIVIDTCSSPLRLTHQVVTYLSDKTDIIGEVKLESVVGVVSAVDADETSAASIILSPLNITSISLNDRGNRKDSYSLQVPIDAISLASALADVLHHLGWTYIVSIYDHENLQSYSVFREECHQRGICLAQEHQIGEENINSKLQAARTQGARVVVLWTNYPSTEKLFESISNDTDFIWIGAGTWIHQSLNDIWTEYENILSGNSFVFSTKEGSIEKFSSYFEHLQADRTRNPWFSTYWHAKNCSDGGCRITRHSVANVIRAVNSLASGLNHLQSEACRTERGLCPTLRQHRQLRQLLNLYIRRQSSRVDDDQEFFGYTGDGSGDIPIGIYKVVRMNDVWPYLQKVGDYHKGLKSLAGMSSGEEITSECISQCFLCPGKKSDYLVTEKNSDFYIAASFTIHGPSENPLECGKLLGIQEIEAFLWAIDQVNADSELLPGIKIGAIIIDTCGSREKIFRDVGNLFSHYPNQIDLPVPERLIGFVAAQSPELVGPIRDITTPLSIPTVAPTITGNLNNDESHYLIRTGIDDSIVIKCLLELLKLYKWNYISIVYSDDSWKQSGLYNSLTPKLEESNIQLAIVQRVSKHNESTGGTIMDNVLRRLVAKAEKGSRVCLLLLSENHMDTFLTRATYWIQRKIYQPGDMQWLTIDNLKVLENHPLVSAGMLTITPSLYPLPEEFINYYLNLRLANNSRNPWFKEYWAAAHKCRGAACYSGLKNSIKEDFRQSPLVSSIINGVFLLSQGLHSLKTLLCPAEDRTPCKAMVGIEARQLLYNFCINSVELENDTKEDKVQLLIMNANKMQNGSVKPIDVGAFSSKSGLTIDRSRAKTYDSNGSEIEIKLVPSAYIREKHDSRISNRWKRSHYLESLPQKPWTIQFMIPIHSPTTNFFTCGEIDKGSFQTIAGIFNSLYEVNRGVIEPKTLGSIIFDTCGQQQRAQEQIFNFFDLDESIYSTLPNSVIAVVSFGEDLSNGISPILESMNMVQVQIPSFFITKSANKSKKNLTHNQSHAFILSAVVQHFGWNSIYLLYSSNEKAQQVYKEFKDSVSEPCIAKSIMLHPGDNADHIAMVLRDNLDEISVEAVILILDDIHLARNVIWAARETGFLNKMPWLETEGWADHHLIQELMFKPVRFLAVRVSNPIVPGFKESFARYTPTRRGNIPKDWFDEMWQGTFNCRLNGSRGSLNIQSVPCTGEEAIIASDIRQNRRVSEIARAIEGIASSLREFLANHCNFSHEIKEVDDCGRNARVLLSGEIQKSVSNDVDFDIVELQRNEGGHFHYEKVGNWSAGELRMSSLVNRYSSCLHECLPCGKRFVSNSSEALLFELLPLFNSIRTLPNVIFTALSSLGIVLVTICALYFLAVFPVTVGTTVLGYTILVGLLLLYASNFVFIMEPIPITCGLRRFTMGFAYSIIYAGMLVKLMNTWRMMDYHGNGMTEDYSRASGSNGLLVLTLGLVTIQIILMASWLVLMPPKVVIHHAKWKCEPVETFELELLVSHTYVFLLLFVAILFGIVTRRSNDNQNEARWILGACLLSALIWIAWPLTIVYVPSRYRHHVLLSANLLSASCVMVCLYLRKAYIYGKLNKKAVDQEIKTRLHPNGHRATYGTSINQRETVTRGIQVRRGRRFEGEDGIGTLQVQVADLYPLDMYDGGTQFPPPGRWSTHRRR